MSCAGSSGTESKAPIVHIWDIVRWKESKLNFVLHQTLSCRSVAPLAGNQVAVPLVHDRKLYLTGEIDWSWCAPESGLIGTALIDLKDLPSRIRGRPRVVFIYYSELHGSFFVPLVCLFCIQACLTASHTQTQATSGYNCPAEADAEIPL